MATELMYVAFQLVPGDPLSDTNEIDLCVLRSEVLNHRPDTDEYSLGANEQQLPRSGVFPSDFTAGMLLVSDEPDELHWKIDEQMQQLLDCVHVGTLMPANLGERKLNFAVVADHASAKEQIVGDMATSDLASSLDQLECEELLLLSCRGGCEAMAKTLSTTDRVVVAPARVIDARKAYLFALFYIWKRFGEGWSAAQTVGSQPIAGNDFRLLHAGRSI